MDLEYWKNNIKKGNKVLYLYNNVEKIATVKYSKRDTLWFASGGGIIGTTWNKVLEVYTKENNPEHFL